MTETTTWPDMHNILPTRLTALFGEEDGAEIFERIDSEVSPKA